MLCKHLLRKAPAAYANHHSNSRQKTAPLRYAHQTRNLSKFRPNFQPKFPTQTHVDFSIEPQHNQSKQTDINTRNAMQFAKLFWSRISVQLTSERNQGIIQSSTNDYICQCTGKIHDTLIEPLTISAGNRLFWANNLCRTGNT